MDVADELDSRHIHKNPNSQIKHFMKGLILAQNER
jgi:hypothetical protein